MKCPKCGYLGFEDVDRCRNCGYDFSLAQSVGLPELPMRGDPAMSPLDDLALVDQAASPTASSSAAAFAQDLDRTFGAPPVPASPDLLLFDATDDVPLITRASPPRTPLAVRRATPEVPRLRAEQPRTPTLDWGIDLDGRTAPPSAHGAPRAREAEWLSPEPRDDRGVEADAGLGARLAAVAIDLGILAVIDVVVVYFTMQICGISVADLGLLPKGPLLAFLFVQNGGYLVAFTAGGQTLGKMAAGIKVVSAAPGATLDLGRALLREVLWFLLAIPAGLGFLTAAFSQDRRGLHDRFAGTRVVRASA